MDKYVFDGEYLTVEYRMRIFIRNLDFSFSSGIGHRRIWSMDKEIAFEYYSTLKRLFPIELLDVLRLYLPMVLALRRYHCFLYNLINY